MSEEPERDDSGPSLAPWDPRGDPTDDADVYDPTADTLEPPKMYYVASTLGHQEWLDGQDVLASAGVAWRNPGDGFTLAIPDARELFVDSGGFQATVHFGGDGFPYSAEQLHDWAEDIGADYVAGMDWACEEADQLAAIYDDLEADDLPPVSERIERTINQQVEQAEVYESGDYSHQFVPVVQGLTVEDYRYCARRLREEELRRPYMAIGTVCKRGSTDEIHDVLQACHDELPGVEFHLFGATRTVWKETRFWSLFRSSDTHAWARNTPEGEWTSTKEDKRRAFEHFAEDIEATAERIQNQDRLDVAASRNQFADLVAAGAVPKRCVCGNVLPPLGEPFTPTCRHCERSRINRWDRNMAAADEAARKRQENRETDDSEQTTLL